MTDMIGGMQLREVVDLKGALSYKHEELAERIARKYELSRAEAEVRFVEVKKFLIVCASMPEPCKPPQELDLIWHEFILHTRDYAQFCDKFLGRFIHHNPTEKPHLASQDQMFRVARSLFGEIEERLWIAPDRVTHDSNCDCSEHQR